METLIKRVISLEEQANALVAEASAVEQLVQKQGEAELQELQAQINEMRDAKIAEIKNKSQYEMDDRIIRIYEDTAMKMRLLEEQAESDQAGWEEDIFHRIIER